MGAPLSVPRLMYEGLHMGIVEWRKRVGTNNKKVEMRLSRVDVSYKLLS